MNPLALITGNWQRVLAYGIAIVAVLTIVWAHGYMHGEKKLFEYQAEQATKAVTVARARDVVTEKVVTKYIERAAKTETVTQTITKEVVRYVAANPGYCLDARWGELHDAAAENVIPPTAVDPDAAARAPTAAGAIETVTENYGACHRNAARLEALQAWVSEQLVVKE